MEPSTLTYFLLGAVGGLAPEIVRLYSIATKGKQFPFSWFYVIVSVLFALLAGLIAVLLPSASKLAAFYAGICTPVLINTIVKKSKDGMRRSKQKKGAFHTQPAQSRFDVFVDAL